MTTPQTPGDPWAAQGPSNPSGPYPTAGQPGYGTGGTPAGYPTAGYQQPGAYPAAGYPPAGYQQQPGYAQPGYAQQGYPQQPGYPVGYGMPAYPGGAPVYGSAAMGPAPTRPATVAAAFWLWIVVVVAGVVSVVLIFTSDIFDEALRAAGVSQLNDVYRAALNTARIAAVAGSLIFAGLYLLFAFKMRAGRNWARIVLTVVAGLGIASTLGAVSTSANVNGVAINVRPASSVAIGWVQIVLEVASIVLMYTGGANQFFAAMKARRMYR